MTVQTCIKSEILSVPSLRASESSCNERTLKWNAIQELSAVIYFVIDTFEMAAGCCSRINIYGMCTFGVILCA